jgi:hypothetical protein
MQLRKGGPADGGEELRRRIRALLSAPQKPVVEKTPLMFRRDTTMAARGSQLAVAIDANGTSWALAADLLTLYDISYEWNPGQRRILIGSTDIAPTYRDDGVQASIGLPLFEMSLQGGDAPVILRGILRDDRAWCRVLEFAEESGSRLRFSRSPWWNGVGGRLGMDVIHALMHIRLYLLGRCD